MEKGVGDSIAEVRGILEETIPFRFLTSLERKDLIEDLKLCRFDAGEIIARQGEQTDEVYILVRGAIETLDSKLEPPIRINRIEEGYYFGERPSLFDAPRRYTFQAQTECLAYVMTGMRFLTLVHNSRAFSQSLGRILREKQAIFAAFDRFSTELMRGVSLGSIDLRRLLPLYQELEPALHPGAISGEIDFGALAYGVSRLPDNVTRTFAYLLTDELPFEFSKPDEIFQAVPTTNRRRNVWEMLPGKSMVLLRNELSDLVDFISCLCIYAVEARKIRKKIADPEVLSGISSFLDTVYDLSEGPLPAEFPLTAPEQKGLRNIWPEDYLLRLRQIAFHREVLSIDIRRQIHTYGSRRTDLWTRQIGSATEKLLGYTPSDLPDNVAVHIISSNTHSVINCLNSALIENEKEILHWAETSATPTGAGSWNNQIDRMYAVSSDYISEHPDFAASVSLDDERAILKLRETVSTGIQVQLIDVNRLAGRAIDPFLHPIPRETNALIVNIDYAFGEQAEEIVQNLVLLFGRRISSINVLGKAGALTGKRGDVLVPTAFIEQTSNRFYPLSESVNTRYDQLDELLADRGIHCGPMLTVAGTLLQNRMMLHFYRHIWNCVGLEMEGTFYYRQILESLQLDVLRPELQLRFLYYVSDLPLERSADLSTSLSPGEGIPPLYAITRQMLSSIFDQENSRRIST